MAKSGKSRQHRTKRPPPQGTTRGTARTGHRGGEMARALRAHMKRIKK